MRLLSVRVSATRLGIAYSTLKQWIYAGRVRTMQTAGGHHRIPEEEVDRLSNRPASSSRTRKPPGDRAALAVLSDANRVRAVVEEVRTDGVLGQVGLRVGDHRLTAMITADALDDLRLRRGDYVVAIFRSTDVMIAKESVANGGMRKRERRKG